MLTRFSTTHNPLPAHPSDTTSPISRVVSAYFFCKYKNSGDQLCADFSGKAENDDILGFAKHWGNYGLMQFVLAFVTPEDIAAGSSWAVISEDNVCIHTDEQGRKRLMTNEPKKCPGWYQLKLFIDSQSVGNAVKADPAGGDAVASLNQVWIHQFLQPVMDILSNNYAAVGLLEQWNTSLKLFQSALEMPINWQAAYRKIGVANADSKNHDEEHETLRTAWYDPKIRELLWLDILLYDHAVSVFNKQIAEHDISASYGV